MPDRKPLVVACLAVLWLSLPLHAAPFTQLVIFGDSLSDTGNANDALGVASAADGYFNGRFSNGPLWVEYLADQLLVSPPVANRHASRNSYRSAFAKDSFWKNSQGHHAENSRWRTL